MSNYSCKNVLRNDATIISYGSPRHLIYQIFQISYNTRMKPGAPTDSYAYVSRRTFRTLV